MVKRFSVGRRKGSNQKICSAGKHYKSFLIFGYIFIKEKVNRSLYLKEGTSEKSDGYDKTKAVVREFLELMHVAYCNKYNKNLVEYQIPPQNRMMFKECSDKKLIELFNEQVDIKGCNQARSIYLRAMAFEFLKRNYGGDSILDENGRLRLRKKVEISNDKLSYK